MRDLKFSLLGLLLLSMMGCVSAPPPKPLASAFYKNTGQMVGIYVTSPEKADTYFPGASCLLCLAVAASANGELTAHVTKLSADEFASLPERLNAKLQEYGIKSLHIQQNNLLKKLGDNDGNKKYAAEKNFRPLKSRYGINTLVVVDIQRMGVERTYSSYVPTSPPRGYVAGRVFVIDTNNNLYQLYQPIQERVAVEGKWDEPPRFPGVTNAFYKAVARVTNTIVSYFEESKSKTQSTTRKPTPVQSAQ